MLQFIRAMLLATLGHVEFTSTHWGITRYIPPLSLDVPPKFPPSFAVPLKLPSFPQRCLMFLSLLNVVQSFFDGDSLFPNMVPPFFNVCSLFPNILQHVTIVAHCSPSLQACPRTWAKHPPNQISPFLNVKVIKDALLGMSSKKMLLATLIEIVEKNRCLM